MEGGQLGRQPAVDLLGIWRVHITGPEARLQVRHRDLVIEGGQRSDEGGCGVTLHHHQIGLLFGDELVQPRQGPLRHTGEGLAVAADIEIVVRNQAEEVKHLVEHAAMLAGDDDPGLEVRGVLQGQDQRSHLDGFGPGTEDNHDFVGRAGCMEQHASGRESRGSSDECHLYDVNGSSCLGPVLLWCLGRPPDGPPASGNPHVGVEGEEVGVGD